MTERKKKSMRLTTKRIDDIDKDEYKRFLECLATLTRKEKEILELYMKGYSSKDILDTLSITDNTLKYHNRNIYSKLGVKSRKQRKRQVICWIENHFKKIDNYIEN